MATKRRGASLWAKAHGDTEEMGCERRAKQQLISGCDRENRDHEMAPLARSLAHLVRQETSQTPKLDPTSRHWRLSICRKREREGVINQLSLSPDQVGIQLMFDFDVAIHCLMSAGCDDGRFSAPTLAREHLVNHTICNFA